MKNNRKLILSLAVTTFVTPFAVVSCVPSCKNNSSTNENPSIIEQAKKLVSYDKPSYSNASSKIIQQEARKINKQVYKTDLLEQYSKFGFKYPGYDFNYESGRNAFIKIKTQEGGKEVEKDFNISTALLNEKVKGEPAYQYNSTDWIKKEIQKGTLKKHPFAEKWFQKNVSDDTLAVEKQFTINTLMTGHYTSGLYGAAGEVIEVEFSERTYNIFKAWYGYNKGDGTIPIEFIYNQNYWENREYGNSGQISNRYPHLRTIFGFKFREIDPIIRRVKIASPFGGGISFYIKNQMKDALGSTIPISFTVHNAVETISYVHNQTTKED